MFLSRITRAVLSGALCVLPAAVHAQTGGTADRTRDSASIIATSRNYIDGFAHGDSARMRSALHPDLAKRLVTGRAGSPSNMTANDLVRATAAAKARASAGGAPPRDTPADSIRIVDRYKDMAMVRIGASTWVDYLHVARFGDTWQIVNVAWQMR